MEKKILVILFVLILIAEFFLIKSIYYRDISEIPSKCYTSIQPSPFLSYGKSPSPATENHDKGYIKIDIEGKEFYSAQVNNSGSMRPTISDFATLIFIKPNIEDIKVGDIIDFRCMDMGIVHRVINITNKTFITKGDNNKIADEFCQTKIDDIKGKVIMILY